jgi:DNA-binding LacI/PurR family transcriptional regulator
MRDTPLTEAALARIGQPVTLRQVAMACGVNPSTVSRILADPHGHRHAGAPLRAKVLRTAWELGYLKPGTWREAIPRVPLVGFLNGFDHDWAYSNQAIQPAILANALNRHGLDLLWCTPLTGDEWSLRQRDDAIAAFIVHPHVSDIYDEIRPRIGDRPTVLLNWWESSHARQLAVHLVDLGHRRIALIGRYAIPTTDGHGPRRAHHSELDRTRGLEQVLHQVGGTLEHLPAEAEQILYRLRQPDPPTALVVYAGWSSIEVMHHLMRQGIRMPQDVSFASLDDGVYNEAAWPPITSVRLPWTDILETAALFVAERLHGDRGPVRRVLFPEQLLIRSSTGPPPG